MSISSFINSSDTTNAFWIAKTVVWVRSRTSRACHQLSQMTEAAR
ncbi:MAG: hypothetical protein V7K71_23760 [Nostoc sp.]